ncbi:hypothetical protein SADUNF_Sadunf16G0043600 [Salix dunnii]|uniref:Uncharacterized protein n=1 Tax=Salix dunnii TaxID=1413687 RepID=A0A835J507_9ROSI|nr:hypothetical protein SADUNF_Sadunf16G0043600 [Salix dunnii]
MKVVVLPFSYEGSRFCGFAACNQVSSPSGLSLSASSLCLLADRDRRDDESFELVLRRHQFIALIINVQGIINWSRIG